MEKNKIRKGERKDWWAWVGLSFKLRWLDLWVSGERTVQTRGAARAEAPQDGQQAAGCSRWSVWTEQGLYPQKPGRLTCSSLP